MNKLRASSRYYPPTDTTSLTITSSRVVIRWHFGLFYILHWQKVTTRYPQGIPGHLLPFKTFTRGRDQRRTLVKGPVPVPPDLGSLSYHQGDSTLSSPVSNFVDFVDLRYPRFSSLVSRFIVLPDTDSRPEGYLFRLYWFRIAIFDRPLTLNSSFCPPTRHLTTVSRSGQFRLSRITVKLWTPQVYSTVYLTVSTTLVYDHILVRSGRDCFGL